MKSLIQYITEGTFLGDNWKHHGKYDYADQVLTKLINNETLKLGKHGEEGEIDSSAFDIVKLSLLQQNLIGTNYTDFDDCLLKKGHIWTKIFKGDFSGYNGTYSKNKGNAFENHYVENFVKDGYKNDLANVLNINSNDFVVDKDLELTGQDNTKRPLKLIDDTLYALPNDSEKYKYNKEDKFNIGKAVADVVVPTNTGDIYLSLKYGTTVTFINSGINNKECFPKDAFDTNDSSKFGPTGNSIIDLFNIDKDKFINVFNNYTKPENKTKQKATYDTVNIVNYLNEKHHKKNLFEFIKSVIGCGFILVHQIGSQIHYLNLMKDDNGKDTRLTDFIGDFINDAYIQYPLNGTAKRINIYIELNNISFKFNIRAKDGGIRPTHLLADYTIKNYNIDER